jgi:hypothetical protein
MKFISLFTNLFKRKPKFEGTINPVNYFELVKWCALSVKFSPPFKAGPITLYAVPSEIHEKIKGYIEKNHPEFDVTPGYPQKEIKL